jgi:hypothetical protein
MKTFEFRHAHGTVKIKAINGFSAQLKYRERYKIDFISYKEVK